MDREKVMSWLEGLAEPDWRECYSDSEVQETARQALNLIDELLKEQERKKGSWDYGTQCSVCKGTIVPPWKRDTRVNFCPWCGADMRGGYDA